MSGTGKSTIIRELRRKGFTAIDMDDPGWSTWDSDGRQIWLEEPLEKALDAAQSSPVFVSGCAENQVKFYPQFSHIVLLSAPTDIIRKRLASRESNAYGKQHEELARILDQLAQIEPLLRQSATHEIDTTSPVDQIVTTLISLALSPVRRATLPGLIVKKTKPKNATPELDDDERPSWVNDASPGRSTPYTEEELDLLVQGTIKGIRDTAAWKDLVRRVSRDEARRVLRSRLIMRDENANRLTRH
jgi:shikimate kinase